MDVAVKVNEVGHCEDELPVGGLRMATGCFRLLCAQRVEGFVAVGHGTPRVEEGLGARLVHRGVALDSPFPVDGSALVLR